MLRPLNQTDDGIILEFKVHNPKKEANLEETVQAALQQITEKQYEQTLLDLGGDKGRIRKYGFAFRGERDIDWMIGVGYCIRFRRCSVNIWIT